ncbi:putative Peptidase M48, Ste24p family; putative exported protein [Cupriavidus taiwanensis]|uniref:Peptidase M48, Ste24p family putative exported protein n=2 Tax=Cupriavidus taiwanensis TaxID=164546 RepID=A0A976A0A6_9BURK|nr:M48 family metallopeptidase [Cupriavidus taiwanensis]SOY49253.1 putative Peptidase M48, Ste24p family; putative exported protein [Cupriavidus taiwanensis]
MKRPAPLAVCALACSALLAGCAGANMESLTQAGGSLFTAATLSDSNVKTLSDQSCAEMDKKNTIAAANSTYARRLATVMTGLGNTGLPLDAKVYMTKDINAWAMANGCVRVYSGLMDLLSDDEVRGVVGHEIGHVALGHTKAAMQVAYTAAAARGLLGSTGIASLTALSSSQIGALAEQFVNAQFSQRQETAADDYSFDLLTKNGANRQALASAFRKMSTLDGGQSSMLSSHPGSLERAKHIEARLGGGR